MKSFREIFLTAAPYKFREKTVFWTKVWTIGACKMNYRRFVAFFDIVPSTSLEIGDKLSSNSR